MALNAVERRKQPAFLGHIAELEDGIGGKRTLSGRLGLRHSRKEEPEQAAYP